MNQSRRGIGINATGSTSSLQLGSQIFKNETPISSKQGYNSHVHLPENPREKPPMMMVTGSSQQSLKAGANVAGEYPNLQKLRERRSKMCH
mmetsp:Transcript_36483/g.47889  ORF Transcript_36483/g.47889 Transcript_36483/m.47889 type:complete len:91 (-) Transcript_36483:239-511(-)